MKKFTSLLSALLLAFAVFAGAGCTPAEDDTVGDEIEETTDDMGDAAEEAGDNLEDATE